MICYTGYEYDYIWPSFNIELSDNHVLEWSYYLIICRYGATSGLDCSLVWLGCSSDWVLYCSIWPIFDINLA